MVPEHVVTMTWLNFFSLNILLRKCSTQCRELYNEHLQHFAQDLIFKLHHGDKYLGGKKGERILISSSQREYKEV